MTKLLVPRSLIDHGTIRAKYLPVVLLLWLVNMTRNRGSTSPEYTMTLPLPIFTCWPTLSSAFPAIVPIGLPSCKTLIFDQSRCQVTSMNSTGVI